MTTLTRRQALVSGAALPLAALIPSSMNAAGHSAPPAAALPQFRDFVLGDFKVTTLLAGSRPVPEPHKTFGLNVDEATFNAVSEQNFIPADVAQFFFTPTIINTGSEVILFDTGLDPAGIAAAVTAAGYATDDVTHVVLTHMHGDHIGGMSDDTGALTFGNAAYITGQTEFDHWAGQENDGFNAKVRHFADRFTFLSDQGEVRSGISAVFAPGHTPGHMAFRVESGGKQLLLMADTANHYVYSLAYPEWEVRFDADKAQAAATRKTLLDMAAADRMAVIGYHMPFPGLGFVETRGEGGYHYVPHSYQLM